MNGTRRVPAYAGLAAALAMLASGGEFLVLAVNRYALHRPVYQSIDVLWAKPVVNAALFLVVAGGLWLARLAWPGLPDRWRVWVLLFLACASPLLGAVPGSPVPMLILAAGIAVRLAGPAIGWRTHRLWWGAGPVAAGALAATVATQVQEAARGRVSADAGRAGAPNVLLIILDTVRAASLGLYGGPHPNSPSLELLARGGTTFDLAVAPASWTLPTHATLFTGLWPAEHGADWRSPLGDRAPVLADLLARAGYRTGGFVANLAYATREHGLARGFQVYRQHDRSLPALLRTAVIPERAQTSSIVRRLTRRADIAGRKPASVVSREFLDWQAADSVHPWFAFLNYFDAHEPYQPPPGFAGRYSAGLPPRRRDQLRFWNSEGAIADWSSLSAGEVDAERAAYEESIAALDTALGNLFEELDRRGALANTLVVVTSDHGEQFGEHGLHAHGNSLEWRSIHVPLVVSFPGRVPAGRRVNDPVSLRDLPATILSFAGVADGPLPGTSLFGDGPHSPAFAALTADPWMSRQAAATTEDQWSVTTRGWHYVRFAGGREQLFPLDGLDAAPRSVDADPSWRAALDSARALLRAAPPRRGAP